MIKLINLIICFILINNYGHSKKLSFYIDDQEFERVSIDKYRQMKSKKYDLKTDIYNFKSKDDLEASASSNEVDITRSDEKQRTNSKQEQRFRDWYDIGEHSNQTSPEQQTIKLESNLSNLNNLISSNNLISKASKKKWRLVSSSTLSDTSIDDDHDHKLIKKQKKRKSRKLKTANLEVKFKNRTVNSTDFVKNKFENTTVYTLNPNSVRKNDKKVDWNDDQNNLKFKLNDAINYKNYDSIRIKGGYSSNFVSKRLNQTNHSFIPVTGRSNDTLSKRTQLTGESKISKKLILATMLPSMIKGLTQSHTHVAVLPTTSVAAQPAPIAMPIMQPAPMPVPIAVPQIHIVAAQPRPVYHHVIRQQPTQIVTQPIITQPIISQPIIHQQPIVQRKIITQPVYIRQPVQIIRTIKPQPIYHLPAEQSTNCNQPDIIDDSNEDTAIGDPVDDEENSSVQQSDDSYSQESWGNNQQEQQVRIMPQPIIQQQIVAQQPQDSWNNQVQNQRVYAYHTASVPKTTRTVYTHTKMIPSFTTVHSTTSYTPEHKHTIVETEHNVKPVMSLVSAGQRKVISRPVYTVKAIPQSVQTTAAVAPTYVSNNQGSWPN